jgi:hypothetical protein
MATGHMLTNRGRLLLVQGAWDDVAATIIRVGLVKVQPAAADTQAEIDDMNTVAELITTAGATECDFTNYARKNLSRTNWTEDDTNNRAQAVAAALTWTAAGGASNNTVLGAFFYDATTDTNDTTRLLLSVDWFATGVATNGGDWTYDPSAGLYRAA